MNATVAVLAVGADAAGRVIAVAVAVLLVLAAVGLVARLRRRRRSRFDIDPDARHADSEWDMAADDTRQ